MPKASKPAKPAVPAREMVREPKGSPRGLVPSAAFGRFDIPYNAYLAELDLRGDSSASKAAQLALAASSDQRFVEFFARLSAPRYKHYSLATIAKTVNIGLAEFMDFWSKAQHARTIARAQEGSLALVGDLVVDAMSTEQICDRCDGYGVVADDRMNDDRAEGTDVSGGAAGPTLPMARPCPACKGKGSIRRPGDTDSRRMLLEVAGHSNKKSGGVSVAITNYGGAGMESAVKLNDVSFDVDLEANAE